MKLSITSSALSLCLLGLARDVSAETAIQYVEANGLNFTCTVYDSTSIGDNVQIDRSVPQSKNIMMLHGFPMNKEWWNPLIEHWDSTILAASTDNEQPSISVKAVACDLRGYSPGASPDDISEYDYSIFADDVWAIADTLGMDTFHLLGHDHGAGLAWYMAGNDDSVMGPRIESLTTFSVPHIDLLSGALCGDNVDTDQVIALNYFNQFALPDGGLINNASLTNVFSNFGLGAEPVQFQKMLWWYIGSVGTHFSQPRIVSDAEVADFASRLGPQMSFFIEAIRQAVPMEERACQEPTGGTIGAIDVPTLFVCGSNDFTLLCNNPYATEIPDGLIEDYEHTSFQCGHDFFLEGNCIDTDESIAVMEKVTDFLFSNALSESEPGTSKTDVESTDVPATAEDTTNVSSSSSTSSVRFMHLGVLVISVVGLISTFTTL